MFLSILIPAYNEEATIVRVLDEHIDRLKDLEQWEIVCLDDASTDRTLALLKDYARRQPRMRLIQNPANAGIVAAYQRLFGEAKGDYIYVTGADGQWPAENLTRLLEAWRGTQADLIIGVRQQRGQVYSLGRKVLSYGFNFLTKVFLGVKVRDANGIKLGRREFFTAPVRSKSFFAEVERLSWAYRQGHDVVYTDVVFLPRLHGVAHGAKLSNTLGTLRDFIWFLLLRPTQAR